MIWGVLDDPVRRRKDKCILTHARAVIFFLGARDLTARARWFPVKNMAHPGVSHTKMTAKQ